MGRPSIDDKVKEALLGHKVSADNQGLFESLGIEEKRKRRPVFWWFFGGGIIAMLLVGTLLLVPTGDADIPTVTINRTTDEQEMGSTLSLDVEGADIIEESQLKAAPDQAAIASTIAPESAVSTIKRTAIDNQVSLTFTPEDSAISTTATSTTGSAKTVGVPQALDGMYSDNLVEMPSGPPVVADEERPAQQLAAQDIDLVPARPHLATTALNAIDLHLQRTHPPVAAPVLDQTIIQPIDREGPQLTYTTYAEYGMPYRDLVANSSRDDGFAAFRRSEERLVDYFSLGILVNRPINRTWSLHTGIDYMHINEQFGQLSADTAHVPTTQVTQLIDYNGEVSTSTSDGLGLEVVEKRWTYNNYVHQVSIPLGVRFHLKKDRWSFDLGASALLRLLSSTTGHELLQDRSIQEITPSTQFGFGLGMMIDGGLRYTIADQWSIGLGPVYRQQFSPVGSSSNTIASTYRSLGARVTATRLW